MSATRRSRASPVRPTWPRRASARPHRSQALLERLAGIDPALLSQSLPDGATLAQGIREDGSEHYREHTADLRSTVENR